MRTYTVVLEYDEDVLQYGVRVPALPGCYSQGVTVEEALANAEEAIAGHIAALEEIGSAIPTEEGERVAGEALAAVTATSAGTRVLVSRVAA